MFSNDNNVETLAQLIERLKRYIGLQTEYVKLNVIEKVVRLFTAIAILTAIVGLLSLTAIYFSFAAAYALQPLVGSLAWAFLIVGGVYLLLLILIVLFRHQLIQRPLVKFLAHLLMSKYMPYAS